MKDVVACATVNVSYVTGFTVTQDWERRMVRNGLAAQSPGIRAAAAQFETAVSDGDQNRIGAATTAMESACTAVHLGQSR